MGGVGGVRVVQRTSGPGGRVEMPQAAAVAVGGSDEEAVAESKRCARWYVICREVVLVSDPGRGDGGKSTEGHRQRGYPAAWWGAGGLRYLKPPQHTNSRMIPRDAWWAGIGAAKAPHHWPFQASMPASNHVLHMESDQWESNDLERP